MRALSVGKGTDAERQRIIASLIAINYTATHFDAGIMLKAVEMSEATPWRFPSKQFVGIFQKPNGNLQALMGIFADFLIRLYRADYLPRIPEQSRNLAIGCTMA